MEAVRQSQLRARRGESGHRVWGSGSRETRDCLLSGSVGCALAVRRERNDGRHTRREMLRHSARMSRAVVLSATICAGMSCCGGGAGAAPSEHVALASVGCPTIVPRLPSRNGTRPGTVVNPGATTLLLCRYSGERHLSRARHVTRRTRVTALIRGLNSLPPFPRGTINCPTVAGGEIVILAIRGGRYVGTASVEPITCFEVSNGVTRKFGLNGEAQVQRVVRDLESLVPPDR
jgi:hypothetical protein